MSANRSTYLLAGLASLSAFAATYTLIDVVRLTGALRSLEYVEVPNEGVTFLASEQRPLTFFFGKGSASLGVADQQALEAAGRLLVECGPSSAQLVGFASSEPFSKDSDNRNLALTNARAKAVRNVLLATNYPSDLLTIHEWSDFGAVQAGSKPGPVIGKSGFEALNRRVEVTVADPRCLPAWVGAETDAALH